MSYVHYAGLCSSSIIQVFSSKQRAALSDMAIDGFDQHVDSHESELYHANGRGSLAAASSANSACFINQFAETCLVQLSSFTRKLPGVSSPPHIYRK